MAAQGAVQLSLFPVEVFCAEGVFFEPCCRFPD